MSYIQPVFDLVKPISLDFQTNLLGVFQALYEDDCEPISFFAVVRAFSALQPSGDALQHFNDKWVKKSGLQKLRGAGIDTITGKSSITGAMAKTREGKIALLIISLLIDALGANITSSLAYEIISATADVQPETQPTRTKVARVISAIQSQIRHVSWHQEIMNAQGYVHNQAADRVQGQRTLFNVPEEAMKIFYQVLCTVSRFPNDYHCILQTTCSITLAFVLAHSICGLQICVVVDGIVVYGNAILGHWHVKLDKKQESAEQDCTEIKLGHKLQDPDVLLTTTGVGPLLEVEQVDADKTRKRTQGDDRGDSPIIDVLGNDDNCTDSERSWAASSLWDTQNSVGSSATSGLPTGIMRISIQKLADVVLDEAGLTTILEAALPYPYLREDLLEEFKRLMRCYYRDVKDSSSTPDHMKVIQLFKKSKSTITSRVKQTLGLNYAESMLLERGKKLSQQEKKEITLRLLHKQDVLENPPTKGLMDNGTHDASSENDSEDDNNFADDLYPGISAAIAFLKHGSPMQIFQANTCQFILNAIREHDVLQSPRSLPRSLPNIVDDIWRRICPNLPEEDIPRGRRRIRWTCVSQVVSLRPTQELILMSQQSCGLKMYDDFDELVDGAVLDDLETRLNRNNFTQHSNASGNAVSQVLKWSVRHAQLLKSHLWGQPVKNDALPTHHARIATAVDEAAPESHSANLLYLLHCNSTGEHGVKLHQDLIHYKLNDQELFRFLRTVYCRARKGTKWFTLRNTTSISLCKVCTSPTIEWDWRLTVA